MLKHTLTPGTRIVLSDPYSDNEHEVVVLAHNVSFDAAVVEMDNNTDRYHISNFSTRFVRII